MTVPRIVCARWGVLVLAVLLAGAFAAPARAGLPERIVHTARVELTKNVHEIPNGSNEAPAIRRYRKAVRWSSPRTAWCGYFVSYVAGQAGAPLGDHGEGIGTVGEIRRWGKRTKRWSTRPHKGNIAVFAGHVGIVERVVGSRWIVTIEGNHANRVARVWHSRSELRGYVRLRAVKPAPAPGDDNSPTDSSPDESSSDATSSDDSPVDDVPSDDVPWTTFRWTTTPGTGTPADRRSVLRSRHGCLLLRSGGLSPMGGGAAVEQHWGMERGEVMSSPTVTEVSRLSAHRREVALVRQSLLSGMQQREQVAQQVSRLTR